MELQNNDREKIQVYTTTWCRDCHRAKWYLNEWGVEYEEIDIEKTPGAAQQVMDWANGRRVVPTILVGDRVLINPLVNELAGAVGVVL